MDGLLLMVQENVFKSVPQLLHFMVISILSDVLIHVLKEDINLPLILRDPVAHTVLLHTWEIRMQIIQHGLVLVFAQNNKIYTV